MAHTRTRRLFKRKLHLHSYMYMDKTSQGRNASSWWSLPRALCCQAFLALRLCARSHRPEPQTALVPSQASTRSQPVITDFTRSQPHWLHSFPGRPRRPHTNHPWLEQSFSTTRRRHQKVPHTSNHRQDSHQRQRKRALRSPCSIGGT